MANKSHKNAKPLSAIVIFKIYILTIGMRLLLFIPNSLSIRCLLKLPRLTKKHFPKFLLLIQNCKYLFKNIIFQNFEKKQ